MDVNQQEIEQKIEEMKQHIRKAEVSTCSLIKRQKLPSLQCLLICSRVTALLSYMYPYISLNKIVHTTSSAFYIRISQNFAYLLITICRFAYFYLHLIGPFFKELLLFLTYKL